jgi:dephospho-CoA kinase
LITFLLGYRLAVVGLSGGIASGKSTASSYARDKLGYVLIDADQVAREVVKKGTSGYNAIVKRFGVEVVDPVTGELDRKTLGSTVFADAHLRKQLESITHPRILSKMLSLIIIHRILGHKVLIDVPLLFESKIPILYWMCKQTILVDAEPTKQSERLKIRNPDMTPVDIANRIRSQMTREEKRKYADIVIDNNGSIEDLYKQLDFYLG